MSPVTAPRTSWIRIAAAMGFAPFLPGVVLSCLSAFHTFIIRGPALSPSPIGLLGQKWLALPLTDPITAFGPGLTLCVLIIVSQPRLIVLMLASAMAGASGFTMFNEGLPAQSTLYGALGLNILFSVLVGGLTWWMIFQRPSMPRPKASEWRLALATLIVPLFPGPALWLLSIATGKKSWMPFHMKLNLLGELTAAQLFLTIPSAIIALVMVIALRVFSWTGASAFVVAGFAVGAVMAIAVNNGRPIEGVARDGVFLFASLGALAMAVGWLILYLRWPLPGSSEQARKPG